MSLNKFQLYSMDYDLPEQFKGKRNTTGLLKAFDRILQDAKDVLFEVYGCTRLETASKMYLDKIGELIGLSRENASILFDDDSIITDTEETSDYRNALMFYVLWKNSKSNYEEWHKIINKIYGQDMYFTESPEIPNTINVPISNNEILKTLHLTNLVPLGIKFIATDNFDSSINFESAIQTNEYDKMLLDTQVNSQLINFKET